MYTTIEQVLSAYAQGTFQGSGEILHSVFWPDAVMHGYLGDQLVAGTPQIFIDDMTSSPSMESQGHPYAYQIDSLSVTGAVAIATVSEQGFKGDGNLVNHFHFIQRDGQWKIIAKLFTTC